MSRTYPLRDNSELSQYLERLAATLIVAGQTQLATQVRTASRFSAGSASEFLHEAQLALVAVSTLGRDFLSAEQNEELVGVLAQIDEAFRCIGGA